MSLDPITELTLKVTELLAMLHERCPQHAKEITGNSEDIDAAFSRIRKLERGQTGLLALAGLISPVLTAILIKYVVG